ncbi:unnamed protein product [Urochloa humidicola]
MAGYLAGSYVKEGSNLMICGPFAREGYELRIVEWYDITGWALCCFLFMMCTYTSRSLLFLYSKSVIETNYMQLSGHDVKSS